MVRWLRNRDVPLASDSSTRFVPWIIGTMVFLSALVLAVALVLESAIDRWQLAHSVQLTVEVPPSASEGAVERVLERLRGLPGVTDAAPVGERRIAELLQPWIGEDVELSSLPLPTLIDVRLSSPGALDIAAMQTMLAEVQPGVRVDDGRRWLEPVRATASALQVVSGLVLVLIVTASIVTVIFMTRTGLAVHRDTIGVLHQVGARDSFVAAQFQRHAFRLALWGGVPGALLAALCLVVIERLAGGLDAPLLPELALGSGGWIAIALLPLIAAAISVVTARLTVLATLAALP
jgi:cell division transport system permease protein